MILLKTYFVDEDLIILGDEACHHAVAAYRELLDWIEIWLVF